MTRGRAGTSRIKPKGLRPLFLWPVRRLCALKRVKARAPSPVRKSVQALHATVGQDDGVGTRALTD